MGSPSREVLVRIARMAAAGLNRPRYCMNPSTFDPDPWVLDAIQLAYDQGARDAREETPIRGPAVKTCHAGDHCGNWPQCESCGPARL